MVITDDIRNYEVTSALHAELIKTSREYTVLAILKYSFPERFSNLCKSESPDLQDKGGKLGVEVTWGGSPRDELINGESYKYSHAKTEDDREKCLQKIRNNGGDRDEYSINFPCTTIEGDKNNIEVVFNKKLKKLDCYRKHFDKVGLAIMMDIPLLLFGGFDWGSWLTYINNGKFAFVALIHWSGVDIYDFEKDEYSSRRIGREDMDALKKLGRMAAEGIIKDDNSVWNSNPCFK